MGDTFLMNRSFIRHGYFAAASGMLAVTTLLTASSAHAQSYTAGGDARTFAMGGAGIALTQEHGSTSRANPASLAFASRDVVPTFPSLGVRASGPADSNAASTYLLGGMKSSDAVSIAAQYGTANSELGLSGFTSLRMGKIEISAGAVGITHVDPNAAFASWASSANKMAPEFLDPTGRADLWSAGYYTLPSVATGFTLPTDSSSRFRVGLGVRVKDMVGVYNHRIVERYINSSGFADMKADLAPEMGGQNTLTRKGVGADLGMLIRPKNGYGVSAALVVANAVRPSFVFPVMDDSGNKVGQFDILQTTVTAGLGYTSRHGLTLAADIVDIGAKSSPNGDSNDFTASGQQLRIGAEQRIFRSLAVRGGYSNLAGATYGFGFFGMDVAFGKKVPLEVVRTINF